MAVVVPDALLKLSADDDLVDMDSTGGVLADYLNPLGYGGSRAGRAATMNKAMGLGDETSFNVRNPGTSTLLAGMGGSLGGSALGAWLGSAAGGGDPASIIRGSTIGNIGGGVLAPLIAAYFRRKEIGDISKDYKEQDDLAPESIDRDVRPDKHGFWGNLLFPLSRGYRAGEQGGARRIRNEDAKDMTTMDNVLNINSNIPGASMLNIPAGVIDNFVTSSQNAAQGSRNGREDREDILRSAAQRKAADFRALGKQIVAT